MTIETKPLAIIDGRGEVIDITGMAPISADDAGFQLPRVREVMAAIRRYETILVDVLTREMQQRGQTERRSGSIVYALKADAEWVVDDARALAQVLEDAARDGQINEGELASAHQVVVTDRFDHRTLAMLAKRVPAIDEHRRRVEGTPRLRLK